MIIAVNFPISAIGRKKPENIRASTGFEPVTSAIPVRCSTICAVKPHIGSENMLIVVNTLGVRLWNSLPESIRAIRSIGPFKKEINRTLQTFDSHSAIL